MNCSAHIKQYPHRFSDISAYLLGIFGLCCLMLAQPARAVIPIWPPADQSGGYFNYTVPGNPPPTIDATAFYNQNDFIINFSSSTFNPEIYETEDTLYYTNNGLMIANSPLSVNGIFLTFSPGCGFLFDNQSTGSGLHLPASTFYNPGDIHADSLLDQGTNIFFLATVGKVTVSATNVINPGTIAVGENGLIQMSGQSLDLTRAGLTVEGTSLIFNFLGIFNTSLIFNTGLVALDQGVGTDTNADWDPSVFLQPTFAISSFFNSTLFPAPNIEQMIVSPSVPYFHVDVLATNYVLTRAVFISPNPNPNVSESIFFGGNPTPFLGPGFVTIQWTGSYTDPTTGQPANNYLYLNDLYIRGANTNNAVNIGIPSNFTFTELTAPATFNTAPATSAFPTIPAGIVTNNYSYVDVSFVASSAPTNASSSNPSGALTNLPGRIQISASKDLDLSLANISGANYMSLASTNEFKGSPGASIFATYSDIYLGVTNGTMTVSNLLAPNLPHWNGTVQAWSSDWFFVDGLGVTNEYRVLLVNPNLSPVTAPVVQDLVLHGTNTVVSDVFNIIRKLSIDANSLTVTTNLATGGFGSPDGELNWYGTTPLNTVQFPNLQWLTNNGAIRVANAAFFGPAPATPYGAFLNTGLLTDFGTTILATNFLNAGVISNSTGSFNVQSRMAILTNGTVTAGGDVNITATNLVLTNEFLVAGRMMTLTTTNLLTDLVSPGSGVTNANFWSVGAAGITANDSGFNLPVKPLFGDLLGTVVTNIAPVGKSLKNVWAGQDRGYSNSGFLNNAAVGQMVLDIQGPTSKLTFNGITTNGTTNAIYVDCLQLRHYASYTNRIVTTNVIPTLAFNTNLVIYYAQALTDDGISIAEPINHFNGDHLRWVPTYVGNFSSVTVVYPDGSVNTLNAALRFSPDIDSNGNGTPNGSDAAPIPVPSELNFVATVTNLPPKSVKLQWTTFATSTNYIYYKTNLLSPTWMPFTGFTNFYTSTGLVGTNTAHTNWFVSPLPYGSQPTNVWIFDALTNTPHYYWIMLTYPE